MDERKFVESWKVWNSLCGELGRGPMCCSMSVIPYTTLPWNVALAGRLLFLSWNMFEMFAEPVHWVSCIRSNCHKYIAVFIRLLISALQAYIPLGSSSWFWEVSSLPVYLCSILQNHSKEIQWVLGKYQETGNLKTSRSETWELSKWWVLGKWECWLGVWERAEEPQGILSKGHPWNGLARAW